MPRPLYAEAVYDVVPSTGPEAKADPGWEVGYSEGTRPALIPGVRVDETIYVERTGRTSAAPILKGEGPAGTVFAFPSMPFFAPRERARFVVGVTLPAAARIGESAKVWIWAQDTQ